MEFERLWDRPPFTVDHLPENAAGGDLVIAFASVGRDPARVPAPEFVATATGRGTAAAPRAALFVSDASRSWGNDPGFDAALLGAVATLRARGPVGRIATLGLSMGGFAALCAARVLPVNAVLAFSPQWSVARGMAETRWAGWTAALPATLRWPVAPLPLSGRAWLFHGLLDDAAQALAFPPPAGPGGLTEQILFPDQTHAGLVPHLKARGALAGLLEAALQGDRRRLLRIAASAGGRRRRAG